MKTYKSVALLLLLFLFIPALNSQEYDHLAPNKGLGNVKEGSGITIPVTVTIIYDNTVHTDGMTPDWGYSAVIAGLDWDILFDTGTSPAIFESNFKKTGIDAADIDIIVLSHPHTDHTQGLVSYVKMKSDIPVVIPQSFPKNFVEYLGSLGLRPLLADGPSEICEHLYTTGGFAYPISEQALVIDTRKGLVVMTGCSHPGIVAMLKEIKKEFNKNIYMVFGGFHLMNSSDSEMENIISAMKDIGVVKCGATHCTGEKQIDMFRKAFASDFVELGAGNRIVIE